MWERLTVKMNGGRRTRADMETAKLHREDRSASAQLLFTFIRVMETLTDTLQIFDICV